MPTASHGVAEADGLNALKYLNSTEPPLYLTPSPELSQAARLASRYLFSSLNPYAPKSPFSQLLTEGFDAEQVWQQIDLQSQPLLTTLRRQVRYFEKNPQEIEKQFSFEKFKRKEEDNGVEDGYALENRLNKESHLSESESEGLDDDEDDEEEEEEEEEEDGDDGDEGKKRNVGVEDKFLKIKELQEYMEYDEAREYGLDKKKYKRRRDEEVEDEDEDKEDEDELGVMGLADDEDEDDEDRDIRYVDFFGHQKTSQKTKPIRFSESDDTDSDDEPNDGNDGQDIDMDMDDEPNDGNDDQATDTDMDDEPNNGNKDQKKQRLSTHEKEREKRQSEIEEMERANLEPKTWTMQGEVTAAKRPKNSALEVDLDFEHNVRPAPVITEEVTASLEELIQKRILESQFDDVQKPPALLNKAPKERVELDENKSKKGLAELYEDEYAQKTGLVSKALSFSDEQKKEASMLFKKLCVKLDALSHFHFTPKPVIEDMSIQSNVPALAMEEIAPLAVSDAAMLAPEEVFSGKGDIKEVTELTKTDRKRRRAKKKRKFKANAVKRTAEKVQQEKNIDAS